MKKLLLLIACLPFGVVAQDLKDASSDKTSVMEGRLRDMKPSIEKTLPNGTVLSIWTLAAADSVGKTAQYLAKATAKSEIPTANEGMRTIKATFNYHNGTLCGVGYKETNIVQNPAPSVTSSGKDLVFTNGLQTSPSPGSFPEIEKYISETVAEINKLFDSYVNSK